MGKVSDTDPALWQRMLTLNLTSAFLLSRTVLPQMAERRSGRIIHIAARAALDPFPGAAAYLVAKSALISLIRILALELAGSGVTVNGVLPTTIDTPANRKSMPEADPAAWVKPESIAQLLVFLASDAAQGLNGALIPIGAT
jgi:NAD(P)-dependent dehydrogenase (short-subunit alcohol dehydrogenase family)